MFGLLEEVLVSGSNDNGNVPIGQWQLCIGNDRSGLTDYRNIMCRNLFIGCVLSDVLRRDLLHELTVTVQVALVNRQFSQQTDSNSLKQ